MLTYSLKKAPGVPLYEALYRCIRADILAGRLQPGQKLPSKRALASHLEVSKITVEAAYAQLAAEGYILPREKIGYFVEGVRPTVQPPLPPAAPVSPEPEPTLDLRANVPAKFPFSVWSRLQRQVVLDLGQRLLEPVPHQGIPELRRAIADHLAAFRGLQVSPENILVGAGTDFLYNLVLQLLGRDLVYALEEPGYGKIRSIYQAAGVRTVDAQLDTWGVLPESLGCARVLHVSPSHHFPLGIITSLQRRQALLEWARQQDAYLIEDDYDSEFRFNAHPMAPLYTPGGRVIYMNSFTKSLAPSIRMGYMVLPDALLERFRRSLSFYGCTVGSFEQYTLARFLTQGHFEKHINRMRKFYRLQRNRLLALLKSCRWADRLTIEEADAGLHFLVRVDTRLSDPALTALCRQLGLQVRTLSDYYHGPVPEDRRHCLVINYSGLQEQDLERLAKALEKNP